MVENLPPRRRLTIERNLLHIATDLKLDCLPLSVDIFDNDWRTEYIGHCHRSRFIENPHLLFGVGVDDVLLPRLKEIVLRVF